METCQSGLTYLFAKEAGVSNPLASSNLAVSAGTRKPTAWLSCEFERLFLTSVARWKSTRRSIGESRRLPRYI